jgi:hypothetical protein
MGFIRGFVPLGKLRVVVREYSDRLISCDRSWQWLTARLPKLKLTHCSQTDKPTPQQKRAKMEAWT